MEKDEHIGQALKRRRKQKGLSIGQLAYKANMTKTAISLIESGHTDSPKLDTVVSLALALDTTVDTLLIECGMMPTPDSGIIWTPELLIMQRALDTVAQLDPQLRQELTQIILGQAEGWLRLTELAEGEPSQDSEQDQESENTL